MPLASPVPRPPPGVGRTLESLVAILVPFLKFSKSVLSMFAAASLTSLVTLPEVPDELGNVLVAQLFFVVSNTCGFVCTLYSLGDACFCLQELR